MLRLPDVAGRPLLRDAAGDWFRDAVRALYGGYDSVTQQRAIRELFLLVPKKNSKTSYGAALMLTALLMAPRPRAEFLIVAPTQEVSDLAFRQVVGMVEADPVLMAKCQIQDHLKKVTYRETGAFLKVKSFDPRVITGTKPSGVLLDELHVIAESHDADRVIGQLRGGLISQPEGFLVTITTQSERAPAGVFRAELQKARAVRDGALRAPILPLLYELPADVPWRDSGNWWMVTPNAGRSIRIERLVEDYAAAESSGEAELRRWASQHLNVEIGLALQSDQWVGAEYWDQQATGGLTLAEVIRRSDVLTVGIDGGGLDDLLGLCVLGRDEQTGHWLAWSHAWAHPSVLQRRKSEVGRLTGFSADGDLTLVRAIGDDVSGVAAVVSSVLDSGKLDRVGVDPIGIGCVLDALLALGLEQERIVGIPQGWKMGSAIKTTERKLADGSLWHGGSAMMAWAVGNAKVEPRGNAVIITKQAAGTAKIDPLMALFDAATLMSLNPRAAVAQEMILLG